MGPVTFEPVITLGSLITSITSVGFVVGAFVTLREHSRSNTLALAQLKCRIDSCLLEQMKERVDTMWVFQMRRGLSELEKVELGYVKSPIQLTTLAREAIAPLVPQLKEFYTTVNGHDMGLIELAVKIEQEFGGLLSQTVCKKIGINDAACLVLAIAQLRPIGPEDITASLERNRHRVETSMKISAIKTPMPIRAAMLKKQVIRILIALAIFALSYLIAP